MSFSPFQTFLSSVKKEIWLGRMVPSFLTAQDIRNLRCINRVTREMNSVTSCRNTLERLKEWSADTTKFESIPSVINEIFDNDARKFVQNKNSVVYDVAGIRLTNVSFFARGKHSIICKAQLNGSNVGIKKTTNGNESQQPEATMLEEVNKLGLGPELLASCPGFVIYRWVEGMPILDYFVSVNSAGLVLECIREVLRQCYVLDNAGINKNEMTHPSRHILVSEQGVKMIDFERCTRTAKRPRNVTQVCQFFSSCRVVDLLFTRNVKVDVMRLREAGRMYKQRPSLERIESIYKEFKDKS